jgi:hypothetical protein
MQAGKVTRRRARTLSLPRLIATWSIPIRTEKRSVAVRAVPADVTTQTAACTALGDQAG